MYANNIGSYKAFLKSGFLDEGLAKNHFIHNTTFVDKIIMGIENPNFTL